MQKSIEKQVVNAEEASLVIAYEQTPVLQATILKYLKGALHAQLRYIETKAQLVSMTSKYASRPFGGLKWLLLINTDNISVSDVLANLQVLESCCIVYWYTGKGYRDYKAIVQSKRWKTLLDCTEELYLGRLAQGDIDWLLENMYPDLKLASWLQKVLNKEYLATPGVVVEVMQRIAGGVDIKDKRDLIRQVGVGGNTLLAFTLHLLRAKPKTKKGVKTVLNNSLLRLDGLRTNYTDEQILRLSVYNLDNCIKIKLGQYSGLEFGFWTTDSYQEGLSQKEKKGLAMIRKKAGVIYNEVGLETLLQVREILADPKVVLLQGVIDVIDYRYATLQGE